MKRYKDNGNTGISIANTEFSKARRTISNQKFRNITGSRIVISSQENRRTMSNFREEKKFESSFNNDSKTNISNRTHTKNMKSNVMKEDSQTLLESNNIQNATHITENDTSMILNESAI